MKSAPKKHTNSNMDLAVAKCFNEVTKNAVATSLLKFDKSLQVFQKFYIVLLF